MLPKSRRLRKNKDFERLSVKGRSVFGPFFTLRVSQVKDEEAKVAFITSTKVFKKSVDRNRAKRRMRAILRELLPEIPQKTHLLFILKPECRTASHEELVAEVRRVLGKIPEALEKPPTLSPRAKKMQEKRRLRDSQKKA